MHCNSSAVRHCQSVPGPTRHSDSYEIETHLPSMLVAPFCDWRIPTLRSRHNWATAGVRFPTADFLRSVCSHTDEISVVFYPVRSLLKKNGLKPGGSLRYLCNLGRRVLTFMLHHLCHRSLVPLGRTVHVDCSGACLRVGNSLNNVWYMPM